MAPKPRRTENKGLPKRWRLYHGAYYYIVPPGLESQWDNKKQFRLGKTLVEAYSAWSSRLKAHETTLDTIGKILDRYALEVVPTKSPKTQAHNVAAIRKLKGVFGDVLVRDFKPTHAYQYRDRRRRASDLERAAPTAANRELEVLSHAFTKAFEWGVELETHPMIGGKFRKLPTPPRTRYVEDWEVVEAIDATYKMRQKKVGQVIRAYIKIKLLTGRRRSEILRLMVADDKEDGLHFALTKSTHKTGQKKIIVNWSPALWDAFEEALDARPRHIAPWVFCTRRGKPYIDDNGSANAFDSLWQRFMEFVLKTTKVKERFTEHDLRAKAGSDTESLERAQRLLAHASSATTKRIYRRRPERITPAG